MFQFIHAADIHLDSPLRGLERYEGAPVEQIRNSTRRALENLVELAMDQAVAFVLIAGDLYDGDWKDHRTGLYFVSQMAKLREARIPVYLIAGNHDAANKMTRTLPMPDNVRVFGHRRAETLCLDSLGVAIHGQSFATGAVLEDLSLGYPAAKAGMLNIGLLHTSATGREGHEPYAPCTLDGLRSRHYDYWALGHAHKHEVLCEEPLVVFSGNTQGRHVRESGAKGCLLVQVDDQHRMRAKQQSLDVLRWDQCWVDASGTETPHELLDRVRRRLGELAAQADGRPLAVRVETAGPCPAHRHLAARPRHWTEDVRAAALDVAGGNVWVEKVHAATSLPVHLDDALNADGPIGELVRLIEELRGDPPRLAHVLEDELGELQRKLPLELVEGPEAIPLAGDAARDALLDQVRQLLVTQLCSREAAP